MNLAKNINSVACTCNFLLSLLHQKYKKEFRMLECFCKITRIREFFEKKKGKAHLMLAAEDCSVSKSTLFGGRIPRNHRMLSMIKHISTVIAHVATIPVE